MFLRQKAFVFSLGCFLGFLASPALDSLWKTLPSHTPLIDVHFSPGGHCTDTIIETVQKAHHSILVMAYSFTSKEIGDALIEAHQKGVTVKVLIDRSQINGLRSQSGALVKAGIPVWVDPAKGIAHNKVMILDDRYVLTGSFNFTKNAEQRNAENLLVIHDSSLAKIYTENWNRRASMATLSSSFLKNNQENKDENLDKLFLDALMSKTRKSKKILQIPKPVSHSLHKGTVMGDKQESPRVKL